MVTEGRSGARTPHMKRPIDSTKPVTITTARILIDHTKPVTISTARITRSKEEINIKRPRRPFQGRTTRISRKQEKFKEDRILREITPSRGTGIFGGSIYSGLFKKRKRRR